MSGPISEALARVLADLPDLDETAAARAGAVRLAELLDDEATSPSAAAALHRELRATLAALKAGPAVDSWAEMAAELGGPE